jgi:DNA-binding LacI/PurR family transcriptional regulator
MNERVTINHVAQESGVSLATVSLVLRNRPGISPETRARVLEVVERLGYQIKSPPASAKRGRLSRIGMFVRMESSVSPQMNPFYSRVMSGIEEACRRNGISLLYATLPVDENNHPVENLPLLDNGDVDGLLMVGAFVDQTVMTVLGNNTYPIVLVDAYSDTERYDAVISDNFFASYQAVEYLIKKGHQHIGLIGTETEAYPSLRDRRFGYLRALKDAGITNTYIADFNVNRSHGQEEVKQLLLEHPEVTALYGVNDEVSVSAIRAAREVGRHVPQDLSIISYDDTVLAAHANPKLTTMHVDTVGMGQAAVQMLSFRIENPKSARMTLVIHPALIERESVLSIC